MKLVLIAHDIRSTHNVGSLLRTAEGLGVNKVYFTGYTPYPRSVNDGRLPHLADKMTRQITKTALGAEQMVEWEHQPDVKKLMSDLKKREFTICALEQGQGSIALSEFKPNSDVALLLGREVEGVDSEFLKLCDLYLEIPMFGKKESFNVVQAAAMALYQIRIVGR